MRAIVVMSFAVLGLTAAVAARATPVAVKHHDTAARPGLVEVRGGCGPGWHPESYVNRWGHWRVRCVPNRRYW